ncbi:hypothetical protein OSTOST_00314 [Ostertagia ostertagi]
MPIPKTTSKIYGVDPIDFLRIAMALKFDPIDWQNVLLIGLGGGTQNNFLSAVDFIKVNLTTVELSPLMVTIATDWFGLLETRTNNVFVEDGVNFLLGAVQRDEKYRSIILDACTDINQSIICPAKDFMKPSVIQNIARVLDDDDTTKHKGAMRASKQCQIGVPDKK